MSWATRRRVGRLEQWPICDACGAVGPIAPMGEAGDTTKPARVRAERRGWRFPIVGRLVVSLCSRHAAMRAGELADVAAGGELRSARHHIARATRALKGGRRG